MPRAVHASLSRDGGGDTATAEHGTSPRTLAKLAPVNGERDPADDRSNTHSTHASLSGAAPDLEGLIMEPVPGLGTDSGEASPGSRAHMREDRKRPPPDPHDAGVPQQLPKGGSSPGRRPN